MQRSTHPKQAGASAWTLPTRQARSERTRDRLLEAGQELLEHGGFDETPVAALARQAGCSVGAFYTRFADKEAFYLAVMALVGARLTDRMDRALGGPRMAGLSGPQSVDACLDALLGLFRDHVGLLRAVQRKSHDQRSALQPLQEVGQTLIDHLVQHVARSHDREGDANFERCAGVGFQIVMSTLLNGVLNHPPRLHPDSPDFRFWLREVVLHALAIADRPVPQPLGTPSLSTAA